MKLTDTQRTSALAAISRLKFDPRVPSFTKDVGPWVEAIGLAILGAGKRVKQPRKDHES